MKGVVIGFVSLACGTLIVLSLNSRAQAQISAPPTPRYTPSQTWEYKVVDADDKNGSVLQSQLNGMGRDGWELVQSSSLKTDHGQALIFTRPVR